MGDFTSQEVEVEFQSHKPGTETEPAIEEASWRELEQLEQKKRADLLEHEASLARHPVLTRPIAHVA
jgi:hypothetical protein